MKVNAYTIYDVKSLHYSNPFYAPTHGAAIRIVSDAAQDPQNSLSRHPADYVLYCVGSYDDSNGIFQAMDPKEHVIDVVALVHSRPTQPDMFKPGENKEAF